MDLAIVVALIGLIGSVVGTALTLSAQRSAIGILERLAPYVEQDVEGARPFSQRLIMDIEHAWRRRLSRGLLLLGMSGVGLGGILLILYALAVLPATFSPIVTVAFMIYFPAAVLIGVGGRLYFRP